MHDQMHRQMPRLDLGHDAVDQKRHVVVEDFDYGHGAGCGRADADLVPVGRLFGDERHSLAAVGGQAGKIQLRQVQFSAVERNPP